MRVPFVVFIVCEEVFGRIYPIGTMMGAQLDGVDAREQNAGVREEEEEEEVKENVGSISIRHSRRVSSVIPRGYVKSRIILLRSTLISSMRWVCNGESERCGMACASARRGAPCAFAHSALRRETRETGWGGVCGGGARQATPPSQRQAQGAG